MTVEEYSDERRGASVGEAFEYGPLACVPYGVGSHLVCDIYGTSRSNDEDFIRDALVSAVAAGHAELLHLIVHRFAPVGLSAIAVIAESHVAVHTWPEHQFVAVDVFTCGERVNPDVILQHLTAAFDGTSSSVRRLSRGASLRKEGAP